MFFPPRIGIRRKFLLPSLIIASLSLLQLAYPSLSSAENPNQAKPLVQNHALEFDGTSDWLDMPDMFIEGDFTLEAWVYLVGLINASDAIVGQVGLGQDFNCHDRIWRWYAPPAPSTFGDRVVAQTPMQQNRWTHVALTRKDGFLSLYLDGNLDAVGLWEGPFDVWAIGRGNDCFGTCGFLEGKMDEIRIWTVARTEEEIQANRSRHLTGTESGLFAYWSFDEGEGQVAGDHSGSGNDAPLGTTFDPENSDPTWILSDIPGWDSTPPSPTSTPTPAPTATPTFDITKPAVWIDLDRASEGFQTSIRLPEGLPELNLEGSVVVTGLREDIISSNVTEVNLNPPGTSSASIDIPNSSLSVGEVLGGFTTPIGTVLEESFVWTNTIPSSLTLGDSQQAILFNFDLRVTGLDSILPGDQIEFVFESSANNPTVGIRINEVNHSYYDSGRSGNPLIQVREAHLFRLGPGGPPSAPIVIITPSDPNTTNNLICDASGSVDPEGEPVSYRYEWTRDGDPIEPDGTNPADEPTLSSVYTSRGQTIACQVIPNDGFQDGPAAAASVLIINALPSAPSIQLLPENPVPENGLAVDLVVFSVDPDGDLVLYLIEWYESSDGENWVRRPELSGGLVPNFFPGSPEISKLYTQAADFWRVDVTPYDFEIPKSTKGVNDQSDLRQTATVFVFPTLNNDRQVDGADLIQLIGAWNKENQHVDEPLRDLLFEDGKDPLTAQVGFVHLLKVSASWYSGAQD